jgi:hypothetical protein
MKDFIEIPSGTYFRWRDDIYKKIGNVMDEEGYIINGEAITIATKNDNGWMIYSNPTECNFNPYASVQPVKMAVDFPNIEI